MGRERLLVLWETNPRLRFYLNDQSKLGFYAWSVKAKRLEHIPGLRLSKTSVHFWSIFFPGRPSGWLQLCGYKSRSLWKCGQVKKQKERGLWAAHNILFPPKRIFSLGKLLRVLACCPRDHYCSFPHSALDIYTSCLMFPTTVTNLVWNTRDEQFLSCHQLHHMIE